MTGNQSQVIAHDIDQNGGGQQDYSDPETPIAVGAAPIRAEVAVGRGQNRAAARVVIWVVTRFGIVHEAVVSGGGVSVALVDGCICSLSEEGGDGPVLKAAHCWPHSGG